MEIQQINLGQVAFNPKGSWNADATYKRLNVVYYKGRSYYAKQDNTNQPPSMQSEYWGLMVDGGDVTNNPDEEDVTSMMDEDGKSVIKFADRAYDPDRFSGKGYKILRKNMQNVRLAVVTINVTKAPTADGELSVTINNIDTHITLSATDHNTTALTAQAIADALTPEHEDYDIEVSDSAVKLTRKFGEDVPASAYDVAATGMELTVEDSVKTVRRNIITQVMISKPNTIYEIRYDFDLNGETLEVLKNCTFNFNGGKLNNGKLHGDSISILSNYTIFDNVELSFNKCNNVINSIWFGNTTSALNKSINSFNNPYIEVTTDLIHNETIIVPYDTEIIFKNCTIYAKNNIPVFKIYVRNIHINYSGLIIKVDNDYKNSSVIQLYGMNLSSIKGWTSDYKTYTFYNLNIVLPIVQGIDNYVGNNVTAVELIITSNDDKQKGEFYFNNVTILASRVSRAFYINVLDSSGKETSNCFNISAWWVETVLESNIAFVSSDTFNLKVQPDTNFKKLISIENYSINTFYKEGAIYNITLWDINYIKDTSSIIDNTISSVYNFDGAYSVSNLFICSEFYRTKYCNSSINRLTTKGNVPRLLLEKSYVTLDSMFLLVYSNYGYESNEKSLIKLLNKVENNVSGVSFKIECSIGNDGTGLVYNVAKCATDIINAYSKTEILSKTASQHKIIFDFIRPIYTSYDNKYLSLSSLNIHVLDYNSNYEIFVRFKLSYDNDNSTYVVKNKTVRYKNKIINYNIKELIKYYDNYNSLVVNNFAINTQPYNITDYNIRYGNVGFVDNKRQTYIPKDITLDDLKKLVLQYTDKDRAIYINYEYYYIYDIGSYNINKLTINNLPDKDVIIELTENDYSINVTVPKADSITSFILSLKELINESTNDKFVAIDYGNDYLNVILYSNEAYVSSSISIDGSVDDAITLSVLQHGKSNLIVKKKQKTSDRPTLEGKHSGFEYYDTILKKKILWNGTDWVNIDGTSLA